MAAIYILKSLKDNRLYIGSTRFNAEKRLSRHNSGSVISTAKRRPLVLLYTEDFNDYSAARKKELYLKSGSGREHLKRILDNRVGTQVAKGGRL